MQFLSTTQEEILQATRYANYLRRDVLKEDGVNVGELENMLRDTYGEGVEEFVFNISTEETLEKDKNAFYKFCVKKKLFLGRIWRFRY